MDYESERTKMLKRDRIRNKCRYKKYLSRKKVMTENELMKESQCEIKHPQKRWITAEHMEISPAYVWTMLVSKKDELLLLPCGYRGHRRI